MDEFDFDLLVKELTDSIGDSEKFMAYITERSAVIVERFLVSLHHDGFILSTIALIFSPLFFCDLFTCMVEGLPSSHVDSD